MERETWEEVSSATEMENSMTYVSKCTKKGHSSRGLISGRKQGKEMGII
jgi:hypothetical protein